MKISVTEAAKQWQVSRTTIYQKIKDGELSRGADKQIDTAEMLRVFGEPAAAERTERQQVKNNMIQLSAPAEHEIASLNHQLELERLKNAHLHQQVSTLNSMIEQQQEQMKQLNKLLDQAQSSINEFAQSRLLELKSSPPVEPTKTQDQPDLNQARNSEEPTHSGLLPIMQKMIKNRLFRR